MTCRSAIAFILSVTPFLLPPAFVVVPAVEKLANGEEGERWLQSTNCAALSSALRAALVWLLGSALLSVAVTISPRRQIADAGRVPLLLPLPLPLLLRCCAAALAVAATAGTHARERSRGRSEQQGGSGRV